MKNEKIMLAQWKKVPTSERTGCWEDFSGFSQWAMAHGWTPSSHLTKHDQDLPHSPENSFFSEFSPADRELLDRWDATVNKLRKHYGLPPLGGK